MRLAMLLVMGCACGRIGYDPLGDARTDAAPPCVPSGHDEDSDGVDDTCDVCPHLADATQPDGDRDGVGDACDPEPTLGRQRIEVFDPFVTMNAAWSVDVAGPGSSMIENDELVLLANSAGVAWYRSYTPSHDHFIISASTQNPGAGAHLLAIVTPQPSANSAFFCELYDGGTTSLLKFTYRINNGAFVSPGSMPMTARFAGGSGTLAMEVDPVDGTCETSWRGDVTLTSAPRPAGVVPEDVRLYADEIDARIAYFLHIVTQD